MYRLAYVESPRRPPPIFGEDARPTPRFRIEGFATSGAALDRAREIIGVPTISAIELHAHSGEVIFDVDELAVALGWPLPPSAIAS
jgi:hypothetical protein